MKDFLHENFDKLILLFLVIVFLIVAVFSRVPNDFAVRTIDVLIGALIGIITGKFMARADKSNITEGK